MTKKDQLKQSIWYHESEIKRLESGIKLSKGAIKIRKDLIRDDEKDLKELEESK